MSYTSIHEIYKTKSNEIYEYKNAFLYAPAFWDYMCEKYLDITYMQWLMNMNDDVTDRKLWSLAYNKDIPYDERICMGLTFDGAVIRKQDIDECVKCLKSVSKKIDSERMLEIADDFELLKDKREDHRLIGYGINCTSVCLCWDYTGNSIGHERMFMMSDFIKGTKK